MLSGEQVHQYQNNGYLVLENVHCFLEEDALAVEVPAGSLVIFHDHMPHYSSQNLSEHSRHAFTMHVAENSSNWSKTNWLQRPTLGNFEM